MWTFFLLKVLVLYIFYSSYFCVNDLFQGVHRAVTTGVIDDERSDSEPSEDENKNDTKKAS